MKLIYQTINKKNINCEVNNEKFIEHINKL